MASPPIPPPGSFQFKLVKTFVDLNVRVYRLTGGRLGGRVKGAPVLLLGHLGRNRAQDGRLALPLGNAAKLATTVCVQQRAAGGVTLAFLARRAPLAADARPWYARKVCT